MLHLKHQLHYAKQKSKKQSLLINFNVYSYIDANNQTEELQRSTYVTIDITRFTAILIAAFETELVVAKKRADD